MSFLDSRDILIIGDSGVDTYVFGETHRLSSEVPVPVLINLKSENRLGLAGNVAANVKALGSEPTLLTVIGPYNKAVYDVYDSSKIWKGAILVDEKRKNTVKTRIMAGQTQLVRMDEETVESISAETENRVIAALENQMPRQDIIIVQDYGKGVITPRVMGKVFALAEKYKIKVLIDPYSKQDPSLYFGADILTPNKQECFELVSKFKPTSTENSTCRLAQSLNVDAVLTTLGKDGMYCYSRTRKSFSLKPKVENVVDLTGARDTVIATLAIGLANGLELDFAAKMANSAAGIVMKKLGTSVCTKEELLRSLKEKK